jgi:hypothetical protein
MHHTPTHNDLVELAVIKNRTDNISLVCNFNPPFEG